MTWAELHGVLRGRGLIRADDALQAEAAVGVVAGIAYDSRLVGRGDVFVALKGQHADGVSFTAGARSRRRSGRVGTTRASRCARAVGDRRGRASRAGDPRG
jgi:hypothetical protein